MTGEAGLSGQEAGPIRSAPIMKRAPAVGFSYYCTHRTTADPKKQEVMNRQLRFTLEIVRDSAGRGFEAKLLASFLRFVPPKTISPASSVCYALERNKNK